MIGDLLNFEMNTKVVKVISGGQTGADEGGLHGAREVGLPTGGMTPKDYRTEKGSNYKLRDLYNLEEHSSFSYKPRTKSNVLDASVTIIFGNKESPGSKLTTKYANQNCKPVFYVSDFSNEEMNFIIEKLKVMQENIIINVAGNRESTNPGIFKETSGFIQELIITINSGE